MTVKNSIVWTTLLTISILTSSCSLLGTRLIETSSKPIEIDIIQPSMPRNIDLKDPKWHVVSSKTIANPCVKDDEGKRPKIDHPDGLLNDNILAQFEKGDLIYLISSLGMDVFNKTYKSSVTLSDRKWTVNQIIQKKDALFIPDLIRFLDNVLQHFIEHAPEELFRAKFSVVSERSLGLGAMGFHSYLQSKNIPFESALAKSLNILV